MIRTLTIVTIAAFFLSIVCISVAVSLAGPDLITDGFWGWGPWSRHIHWSHDVRYDGATTTRDLAWDGGDALTVEIPADVKYTQADGPAKVTVRGPSGEIDHVVLRDGHLRWEGESFSSDDSLDVEITAPKVTQFTLDGSGGLDIQGYRQDQLTVRNNGSGDVRAAGAVKTLDLTLNGSGDADLSDLATDAARVTVAGSADVKVAPKTSAKLDILGSGSVTLTTNPKQLESRIAGSGSVHHADGSTDEHDSDD